MALPTGIVTFFFSDVEGSTRLAAALGDRFADVLEAHRRIVRAALLDHRGAEVSTGGDSFFAVFPAAVDAADAALAIQHALAAAPLPEGSTVRVRIGLHTGQAVQVGNDYVGLDVHLASRIADAGNGGQTLLSEATHAAIGQALPAGAVATDLGRYRLKDVGPQRIWQLDGPGLPLDPFPALRSLEAHPSNLPTAASPLIGREQETTELAALVVGSPIVTVTGAGGIGKSRVAIEAARSLVDGFPDGVFHLDMLATPDAAAAAAALLELVHNRSGADADARVALLDRLRSRDLLLVLDTADRVAGLSELVAAIAATCPRIRVLLTSRSPLHVSAEVEYPLQPMAMDNAVELFRVRAHAARAQSLDDEASRLAIGRLVARLDGIPLAIELAAARTRLFSPAALLDRLERRLPALGQGAHDLPDRQRTLHDTISWSCQLLRPPEQAAFGELGVFVGSFDLPAVESVISVAPGEDPAGLLEGLVDRSLVSAEASVTGEPRFRLLGPIREFALDALLGSGTADVVRERHARHWVTFAGPRLEQRGEEGLDVLRELEAGEPDIHAALEWSISALPELGLELAGLLGRYWWLRGRVREGRRWLESALSAVEASRTAPPVAPDTLARAEFWTGVLLDDAGQPAEAARHLEASLALRREIGDERGIARTLNSLGVVARSLGDLDRAEALFQESLDRKRALDDRPGISVSLTGLGIIASDRGQYAGAVELLAAALEIDRAYGGPGEVVAHANLGTALVRAGRLDEGLTELRAALPGIADLRDPELVLEVLVSLGRIALATPGDEAALRAARLLVAADAVRRREELALRELDSSEVDAALAKAIDALGPRERESLRAESAAIDLDAALSLARDAVREAAAQPMSS